MVTRLQSFVRIFCVVSVAATLFLGMKNSSANVSLRNGNFFMGYTDIFYPGGFEPKIERVYNSKTPYYGMFGFGWGTEIEAYLSVSADGSVVAHEFGGGAENRFSVINENPKAIDDAIMKIAEAGKKTGKIGSASAMEGYKKKLRDATFRNDEWQKYVQSGVMKPLVLPAGTKLVSNRFSYQYLTKTNEGYTRIYDNGKREDYDNAGRLVKLSDKNSNYILLTYNKDGRLQKLIDNFNRKMFFTFNNQGLLEKIEGEGNRSTSYRYNKKNELIYSKDVDGNVYQYGYSTDNLHNMIQIGYSDKTTMNIAYYGKDKLMNVKSVKDRDGTTTDYLYDRTSTDDPNFKVSLRIKTKDGKQVSTSSYEYFLARKRSGEEWTKKMITTLDGDRTETTYDEAFGLPLSIKKGNRLTQFKYDRKGHVIEKDTPTELSRLKYHDKFGKVTEVQRLSKTDKKDRRWSKFSYDDKGNLIKAVDSTKKTVVLAYDRNGRIASMIDQGNRTITFKYDENSKPVEITDPKLGTIHVEYTKSGEVKKVDSSAGRKIALQVTSAFQSLLEIIRPAGVSLAF